MSRLKIIRTNDLKLNVNNIAKIYETGKRYKLNVKVENVFLRKNYIANIILNNGRKYEYEGI